jgi:hypothetical protein
MHVMDNRIVRILMLAAGGALALVVLRELTAWVLTETGKGSAALMSELFAAKLLFTRMLVFFLGLAIAGAAFGKGEGNRWKMLAAVAFLAFLAPPLLGEAFGSMDRTLFFLGLSAVVLGELEGNLVKLVACVVCAAAVMLLAPDNVDVLRRSGVAVAVMLVFFVAPAVFLSSIALAGELNIAPIRRLVAKAVPSR